MRVLATCSLLAACVLLATAPACAQAQPSVRVRAQTRLELQVGRAAGAMTVIGTLRDDLGEPLPARAVDVQVREASGQSRGRERATTDAAGAVHVSFPLETGRYELVASWVGDDGHDAVQVRQPIDLDRAYVRLSVVVGHGGRLDLDVPTHEVEVTAMSAEGGGGLVVEILDELDSELARATTDESGAAHLSLASDALGPPAAGRLIVRTAGDARRARAQTEVPVVRFRATQLDLSAAPLRVALGERVEVSGRLSDSRGPISRRAIGLFAGDAHLATVLTDDEGRFARSLELDSEHGSVDLRARFASDAPWRTSASAGPITIAIEGAGSTPWPWLLGPMLACALAIALLSRRPRATSAPARALDPAIAPPGIAVARASSLGAQQRDVAGTVLDADEGAPIRGALIRLRDAGGASIEVSTDGEGRFAIARVEGDAWSVEIAAEGYERSEGSLRVPHRGQWSAVTVRLRSLRQLALLRYRPLADALAPQRKWWAFWTPRELLERAEGGARVEIAALTAAVERAAYAAPHPSEGEVDEIGERSARIAQSLDDDG